MFRRNGRARCRPSDSANTSERPGLQLELQSGKMRFVFGGGERDAEADVHGAHERFTARSAGHDRTDESVSSSQRSHHGRLLEFFGEAANQTVLSAPAGCTRWHMADAASRYRSCSGISEVYRMFPVPGRLPRAARSSDAQQIHRAAFSHSRGGARDASTRYRGPTGGIAKHPGDWLMQYHEVLHTVLS